MRAWIFPGQGSQYPGMGRDLFVKHREAREVFEKADEVLGFDLSSIMFDGSEEDLRLTEITQPAILTHSIAAATVLKYKGLSPDLVAGLRLGEFSAMVSADIMDFEVAVKLVQIRGRAMQSEIHPDAGSMAAIIGMETETVEEFCKRVSRDNEVIIANYNCPGQIVISGLTEAVESVVKLCIEFGARKAVKLPVSAPFHSKYMEPVGNVLREFLSNVEIRKPAIPIISNVTGDLLPDDPEEIKKMIALQAYSSVRWEQSVRKLMEMRTQDFLEVGPGKALSGFVRRIDRRIPSNTTEGQDLDELAREMISIG